MPTVYIAGDGPGVGVTSVATGLAALIEGAVVAKAASYRSPDPDAAFHRELQPDAALPDGWPVALASGADSQRITDHAPPVGDGMVLVEGVSGAPSAEERLRIDAALASELDARVLLVSTPASASPAQAAEVLGNGLLGVIVNAVPEHSRHDAVTATVPAFEQQGIPVLGLLPEDRRMLAPTVGEVADHLGADLINRDELDDPDGAMAALVEHFMLGGLFLDTGVYVFGKREQKAVIVRGDRPDLQMAALETSTVCLVLTEGRLPVQYITHHAALNQVPMLLVDRPTLETMDALHSVGERATVRSIHKARRAGELLSEHCDLAPLTAASAA